MKKDEFQSFNHDYSHYNSSTLRGPVIIPPRAQVRIPALVFSVQLNEPFIPTSDGSIDGYLEEPWEGKSGSPGVSLTLCNR